METMWNSPVCLVSVYTKVWTIETAMVLGIIQKEEKASFSDNIIIWFSDKAETCGVGFVLIHFFTQ